VNFNYNIPSKQRRIQQLVAQFNANEELFGPAWKVSAAAVASSIHGCPSNLKGSLIC